MKIVRDIDSFEKGEQGVVATIGNFDGVHLGHRKIFRTVVQAAREHNCLSAIVTFDPHPLKFLAPDKAPPLINTEDEKERLVDASMVDYLIPLPFDNRLASIDPESFVRDILVQQLGVQRLIVGYDYSFGRGRSGTAETMKLLGTKYGFDVAILEPFVTGGQIHASTHVRRLIEGGKVADVVAFLGRHFNLEGEVVHGAKRGAKIGFPTANVATRKELLPCEGVYTVKVKYNETIYDGVVNIGWNPTFSGELKTVEVHILNFCKEIYGERVRIYFIDRLRDEMKFASVSELIAAIERDVDVASKSLQDVRVVEYKEYLSKD